MSVAPTRIYKSIFKAEDIVRIRKEPHRLSHICSKKKATCLHGDWIKYIWDTDKHRSLQAHRGSFKTTNVLIIGTIWWLLFHPDDRIAIVRKKYEHACEVLVAISKLMRTPVLRALFRCAHNSNPVLLTNRNDKLIFNFKITHTPEGSVDAYGIHSEMVGKHYDKIICDDFVTIDDRVSKAERNKTKIKLAEIVNNIIDPGKYVGFVGTPWHKDDAWSICPEPMKYDCYSTGLMSDEQIAEKRTSRAMTRQMFAANYELKHIAGEDQKFQNPSYKRWEYLKTGVFGHLDCKYEGDHTNGLTFMARKKDGRIQAVGFCFHENIKDKYKFVVDKWKKYFSGTLYNEDNADKGFVAEALKRRGILVKNYHENMNKHLKIDRYLYQYWEQIDWDLDTDPEYMNQILDYIEGQEPDDCADSAASLLREKFHKTTASIEEGWQL